jgi:hypothetical protein
MTEKDLMDALLGMEKVVFVQADCGFLITLLLPAYRPTHWFAAESHFYPVSEYAERDGL